MAGFIALLLAFVFFFVIKGRIDDLSEKITLLHQKIDALKVSPTANHQELLHEEKISHEEPMQQEDDILASYASESSESATEIAPEVPPAPEPSIVQEPYKVSNASLTEAQEVTQDKTPAENILSTFFVWLKRDWPMKVGGVLVILAVGWFVTYAAQQGWLSEIARVVLGYLFGLAALVYGTMRAKKVQLQGNVFVVIGVASIFISSLAAVGFKTVQMPEVMALSVMFITVVYVSLVGLQQKNKNLIASTIFFGGVVPLFFFEGAGIDIIFVYLFALTLGTLWVVVRTGWQLLTVLMLTIVLFYAIGHSITAIGEIHTWKNLIISMLFTVVFYAASVSSVIRTKKTEIVDGVTAMGVGMMHLIFVLMFAPEEVQVFFLMLGVLFFALASYAVFVRSQNAIPTVLYAGNAIILTVIATSLQFNGHALILAYVIESQVAIAMILYIARDKCTRLTHILTMLIYGMPMLMVLGVILDLLSRLYRINVSVTFMPLFTIFVATAGTFVIAYILNAYLSDDEDGDVFAKVYVYIGGALTVALVWLATHIFIGRYDVATFMSLLIYTVCGVAFYVAGIKEHLKHYRVAGITLFGIVLARVFIVEFWEMEMIVRIITFFVLGALFISTVFLGRQKEVLQEK